MSEKLYNIELLDDGKVVLDGYLVPHIEAAKKPETSTSEEDAKVKYWISLDGRFGYPFENEQDFQQAIYLVATAMAVACGFSSFGEHCRPLGKFNQFVGGEGDFGNLHIPGTRIDLTAKAEKAY
jgi:hypothetical protein